MSLFIDALNRDDAGANGRRDPGLVKVPSPADLVECALRQEGCDGRVSGIRTMLPFVDDLRSNQGVVADFCHALGRNETGEADDKAAGPI